MEDIAKSLIVYVPGDQTRNGINRGTPLEMGANETTIETIYRLLSLTKRMSKWPEVCRKRRRDLGRIRKTDSTH